MNCHSGSNGSMAIKLDMAKAYDRVEWNFLRCVMLKLGLKSNWVDLVMHYVETTSFSFLINGAPCGYVKPSRGFREGDPISPYWFLFYAEGLSYLITNVVAKSRLMGHRIFRDAPIVSHLLFTYDTIIFYKANVGQAALVRDIL